MGIKKLSSYFVRYILVIFIFVSLISFLIYRFNSSAKEVELKSEATSIAVEEIEKVKQDGFEKYEIEEDSLIDEEIKKTGVVVYEK